MKNNITERFNAEQYNTVQNKTIQYILKQNNKLNHYTN